MRTNELKVGDMLVAIDNCIMTDTKEQALTIGKSYRVNNVTNYSIYVKSNVDDNHEFLKEYLNEFFTIIK